MKTIMFFLFTFMILNVCKAQFIYSSTQYSTNKSVGIHAGYQFKNGIVTEFTGATEAKKIVGGGSVTRSPDLLFLQAGYTVSFDKLQLYALGGVCLYSIGHWSDTHTDVINSITFPLVVSGRVAYGYFFVQGNYLKHASGIEGGFIMKFKKD